MPDSQTRVYPDLQALKGAQSEIRALTAEDMAWALTLMHERYRRFDPGNALLWMLRAVQSPYALCRRTSHALLFATMNQVMWEPKEFEAEVKLLCAYPGHHWQAVRLLRESVAWAKAEHCARWWFSSGTAYDIAMLARRVGAEPQSPQYKLEL
jgi:hypothetical protein